MKEIKYAHPKCTKFKPNEYDLETFELVVDIKNSTQINKVPCGHGQNKIFLKNINDVIINETIIFQTSSREIETALCTLIDSNIMFRSTINKYKTDYGFIEYELNSKPNIKIKDIRELSNSKQKEIITNVSNQLYKKVYDMNKIGNLLYKVVIIRLTNDKFVLVTAFSHLMIDGAGSLIYSKKIQNLCRKGKKTVEVHKEQLNYIDYLNQFDIKNIEKQKKKFLKTEKYSSLKPILNVGSKKRNLQEAIFEYNTDENSLNEFQMYPKQACALRLSLLLASSILEKEVVSFRITNDGRRIGNKMFYNVIGDCHVHYPLVLDVIKDDMYSCQKKLKDEYEYYYVKNQFYLEKFSYETANLEEDNKFRDLFDRLDFVFNYLGKFNKEQYLKYIKFVKQNDYMYKTHYIYAFSYENKIVLNCRVPSNKKEVLYKKFTELCKNEILEINGGNNHA